MKFFFIHPCRISWPCGRLADWSRHNGARFRDINGVLPIVSTSLLKVTVSFAYNREDGGQVRLGRCEDAEIHSACGRGAANGSKPSA